MNKFIPGSLEHRTMERINEIYRMPARQKVATIVLMAVMLGISAFSFYMAAT